MDGNLWPAYILHSRPYQEDKLFLQLLLPEQGRLTAVIRRRSGKQHRALQPFQLFSVALVGRSNLQTVRQLEEQAPAYVFNGKVLFSGIYINELICRLWPADLASEWLFTHYQAALTALAQAQQQPELLEPCLRQFEFALLAELGVLPDWQYDAMQQPIQPEYYYHYLPEQGFIAATADLSLSKPCTKLAGDCWQGQLLLAIAAADWQQQGVLLAAKQLSRQLLTPLLGEKPLASRALFSQLVKVKPSSASSS
ncbi:DNA repair protein RecO [Alishewanella longhuensis]|uniref:DNA repair protein RecO n=1 Tax=Alishewanella longhuensis TaxID=1091037 RepID=A0ABQ3L0L4_9ALTE|nr:DNA repair protein RecO [Alishewanella longhuensis]GHG65162.1 DNA repair protein RecO [Alishewanella longhuensis]